MKFAVIGSGISGLSMALILSQNHEVILYEVDDRFGGHSNTIEVNYNDKKINVDTGFIVFNKLNYPNLVKLFKFLSVDYQDSQILEDFEDFIDVHTILEDTKIEYEKKLEKARAKQPKAEW